MTVALVAGALGGGMFAYFSDIEKSEGNTFQAGTIDIAVDNTNPWSGNIPVALKDLKPCEIGIISFEVTNVGTNELQLWKHINVTDTNTGEKTYPTTGTPVASSEPEWQEENGPTAHVEKNDIDTVINYDLTAGGVIFVDDDGVSVADVHCMWMPLGFLLKGESVVVTQSYHMRPTVTNWAQGDEMVFTIELYAEQKLGNGPPESPNKKLFLDNKSGHPDWLFVADSEWGILDYTIGGTAGSSTMTYDLKANGLQFPGQDYSLIYYPEPQTTWPWPVTIIGTHMAQADGTMDVSGVSGVLPADSNAKIWLCKASDLVGSAYNAWPATDTLYEANKINIP